MSAPAQGPPAPPAPYTPNEQAQYVQAIEALKLWLATAPGSFDTSPYDHSDPEMVEQRSLNRFLLPSGEILTCVFRDGLYHMSGSDVIRALTFRFLAFGRYVSNVKKLEEGVFSDLRNLKAGVDARLEEPKSEFLELLFKYNCIRTQKKQKVAFFRNSHELCSDNAQVFYWFSVPHDRLFLDALDRDLKREKLGQETATTSFSEPALSFVYNPQKSLYDQFANPATASTYANDCTLAQRQLRKMTVGGPKKRAHSELQEEDVGHGLLEGSPHYKARRHPSKKRQKSVSVDAQVHRGSPGPPPLPSSSYYSGPAMTPGPATAPAPGSRYPSTLSARPGPMTAPMTYSSELLTSASDRVFICPLTGCGRGFDRAEPLKTHVRLHASDQPHACHRCPKRFSRLETLTAHNRLHEQIDAGAHPLDVQQEEVRLGRLETEQLAARHTDLVEIADAVEALEAAAEDPALLPASARRASTQSQRMPTPIYVPASAPLPGFARSGWPLMDPAPVPSMPSMSSGGVLPDPAMLRSRSAHPARRPSLTLNLDAERRARSARSATPTSGTPRAATFGSPTFQPMHRSVSFDEGMTDSIPSFGEAAESVQALGFGDPMGHLGYSRTSTSNLFGYEMASYASNSPRRAFFDMPPHLVDRHPTSILPSPASDVVEALR